MRALGFYLMSTSIHMTRSERRLCRSQHIDSVPHVLGMRYVFQIGRAVIHSVPVFVVDFVLWRTWTMERIGHKLVNIPTHSRSARLGKRDVEILRASGNQRNHPTSVRSFPANVPSHPSVVRYGIEALESDDGSPSLYSVNVHAASDKGGVVSARTVFQHRRGLFYDSHREIGTA